MDLALSSHNASNIGNTASKLIFTVIIAIIIMNNILRLFCLFGLLPFPTFVIKNFGKRIRGLE